jgi:hypothetical protein
MPKTPRSLEQELAIEHSIIAASPEGDLLSLPSDPLKDSVAEVVEKVATEETPVQVSSP